MCFASWAPHTSSTPGKPCLANNLCHHGLRSPHHCKDSDLVLSLCKEVQADSCALLLRHNTASFQTCVLLRYHKCYTNKRATPIKTSGFVGCTSLCLCLDGCCPVVEARFAVIKQDMWCVQCSAWHVSNITQLGSMKVAESRGSVGPK